MDSKTISWEVKNEIQMRAAAAATQNDVVDAVFCALIESDIDQWGVSVEDWKGLLFEAFQAAKEVREADALVAA